MQQKNPIPQKQQKKINWFDSIIEFVLKFKFQVLIISAAAVVTLLTLAIMQSVSVSNNEKSGRMYDIALSYIGNLRYVTNTSEREKIYQEQVNNLNGVVQMYPGTVAATRARIYLGKVFYEDAYRSGKAEGLNMALTYYRSVLDSSAAGFYKALALIGSAQCNEQKNDYNSAFQDYEMALNRYKKEGFNPTVLAGMARAKEMGGDINNSLAYYKKIIQEYPDSLWARFAKGKVYFYTETAGGGTNGPNGTNSVPFIIQ